MAGIRTSDHRFRQKSRLTASLNEPCGDRAETLQGVEGKGVVHGSRLVHSHMLLLTGYEQAVGGEAGAVAPGVGRSPVSEAGRDVRSVVATVCVPSLSWTCYSDDNETGACAFASHAEE